MDTIRTIDAQGSLCLIERGGRYAVIEIRAERVYPVAGGRHADAGCPDTPAGRTEAVGDDWTDEASARRRFDEAVSRGNDLAKTIW